MTNINFASLRYAIWPAHVGIKKWWKDFCGRQWFWSEFAKYTKLCAPDQVPDRKDFQPWLWDATPSTPVDASYYFQDAWAFEKILTAKPPHHVDIGSHHKFVSLLSKVVNTTMVDIRPLPVKLDSLKFKTGSVTDLPFATRSLVSVSSLCVVEHIGLGRYGDPLDPNGTIKAIDELMRVIQPGGSLYVSVPIDDKNRTYFNAHRAFCEPYLIKLFAPFDIIDKCYIFGNDFTRESRAGFGTGCYHLRRPLAK